MIKDDLLEIPRQEGEVCVSITMPMSSQPDRRAENDIRFKNLLQATRKQLESQDNENIDSIVQLLEQAYSGVEPSQRNNGGLVLLANKNGASDFEVPFDVEEKSIVCDAFCIKDLYRAQFETISYYLLVFSEARASLYRGTNEKLTFCTKHFPFEHMIFESPVERIASSEAAGRWIGGEGKKDLRGDATYAPGTYVADIQGQQEEHLRQFFRAVDSQLCMQFKEEKLPVILASTEQNCILFEKLCGSETSIIDCLYGAFERHSLSELSAEVAPKIDEFRKKRTACSLAGLEKAKSEKRFAAGFTECWKLLRGGRVEHLFLHVNFETDGFETKSGDLSLSGSERTDYEGCRRVERVVDEMLAMTDDTSARITFVREDELDEIEKEHVCAILRY